MSSSSMAVVELLVVLSVVVFVAFGLQDSSPAASGGDNGAQPASAPSGGSGAGGDSYHDTFTGKTYYKSGFPSGVCEHSKGCLWKSGEGGYNGCYCKPKAKGKKN